MDISKIDRNFALPGQIERDDVVWYDAAEAPFVIYGATQTNPYARMPKEIAEKVNAGVAQLYANTAGVRARFCTDSPFVAIRAEWDAWTKFAHMTAVGVCGFDLYAVCDATHCQRYLHTFMPSSSGSQNGFEGLMPVKGEMSDYVLNFPLYNNVDKLYIGVKEGSRFEAPMEYSNSLPAVFYGSSITQGGCASRPGNCYQNHLSRAFDIDYVNLGFSGSGRGEDTIIEYLAGLEMSAFVSDYDHNSPSPEHLEQTHEKLYRAVREKHPDVPYIMLSRPDYRGREEDDRRRAVIMKTYQNAIAAGDRNVYFVDGASIFAGDASDACTVDGTHPNDLGFYRFFKALQPIFEKIY
ncbi:MAG: SGNH/GDSL hydrolase family protein [Clostridia bacterium]|nr:SGNH/GDSL hydrolase family protein [Clostridia bacterium]